MEKPKRTYSGAGNRRRAGVAAFMSYPDLVPLYCVSMVLCVKPQAVVQLGLPRYLVQKCAAYRKGDIEALRDADRKNPNELLRQLQTEHAKAKERQKAEPSRRHIRQVNAISEEEAAAAQKATIANRNKPPTKDELARDPWLVLKLRRFK